MTDGVLLKELEKVLAFVFEIYAAELLLVISYFVSKYLQISCTVVVGPRKRFLQKLMDISLL